VRVQGYSARDDAPGSRTHALPEVREGCGDSDERGQRATFALFDHGINTAVKKIRQALGDSAENPKYIQTVARRGYRIMVPIEWVDAGREALSGPLETDQKRLKPSIATGELTGKRVSHYRVLEILGGGGMGIVYKAEDLKLGRMVALKFLPEELDGDLKATERFEIEARAASALDHPNICSIYEFGEHEARPFIVMQSLAGRSLRDLLSDSPLQPPFTVGELFDLAIQIAAGLGAAHNFRLAQVEASGGPVSPVPTQIPGAYHATIAPGIEDTSSAI
jgi:hypothetical protein